MISHKILIVSAFSIFISSVIILSLPASDKDNAVSSPLCKRFSSSNEESYQKTFVEITPKALKAINKGLRFLARSQNRSGSFKGGYPVATTSMGCLAFMAAGHTPTRGKYAKNVRRGLKFILNCVSRSGYISLPGDSSGMHGHGFATLFLAECLGMIEDPKLASEVKRKLKKAVRVIERAQNRFGGWNRSPNGNLTDDGSGAVAIMQMTALRAARNAGIRIDKRVIEKAKKYLLTMMNKDGWYQYNWRSRTANTKSSALTGAGLTMLNAMGLYNDPKVKKALKNLMKRAPFLKKYRTSGDRGWNSWFYYTCIYTTLAIFQTGGEYWRKWYPKMRDELIKRQSTDGSWRWSYGVLGTAFALLTLEMPYRFLPWFQEGGRGAAGK
jgi:hypothetical protein